MYEKYIKSAIYYIQFQIEEIIMGYYKAAETPIILAQLQKELLINQRKLYYINNNIRYLSLEYSFIMKDEIIIYLN